MAQTRWITWAVPVEIAPTYIITCVMAMWVLPKYFFGLQFTTFGWLINFLWFDFVFFIWYKMKTAIDKIKRKDDDESNRME